MIGEILIGKGLRSCSLFILFFLLDSPFPVVLFLWWFLFFSGLIFLAVQKPWSGNALNLNQWLRIVFNSVLLIFYIFFWCYALKHYGPIRTILTIDYADVFLILLANVFLSSKGGASLVSKGKVIVPIILGYLIIYYWDDVLINNISETRDNIQDNPVSRIAIISFTLAIALNCIWKRTSKIISLELSDYTLGESNLLGNNTFSSGSSVNNLKLLFPSISDSIPFGRAFGLSTLVALILMTPFAIYEYFSISTNISLSSLWMILLFTIIYMINLYIDIGMDYKPSNSLSFDMSSGFAQSEKPKRSLSKKKMLTYSLAISFITVAFISQLPIFAVDQDLGDQTMQNHVQQIQEGHHKTDFKFTHFLAFVSFIVGIYFSGKNKSINSEDLTIGPISGNQTGVLAQIGSISLKEILSDKESKSIFAFLMVNLAFMFVELIYGLWTNSLGLISDACHMLFDCTALVIGLYASVISKWPKNHVFSFGYSRVQVVSGFINAIFLVFIAFFVLLESIERCFEPPEVKTERLLEVSIAGFLVNLVGIFAFHDLSHGGEGDHHGHSHGHSHGGGENQNMVGVYLHIVADTLGSVGVIISAILIKTWGWTLSDPICSFCISILIFASVVPLLQASTSILLQCTPENAEKKLPKHLDKILQLDGVMSYSDIHFWTQSASEIVGTIKIQARDDANEQLLLNKITDILLHLSVTDICIEIEKPGISKSKTEDILIVDQ